MKFILLLSFVSLIVGCAQLTKGVEQPVTQYRNTNSYKTTCNGIAEDWGSCNRKAMRTCPSGYAIDQKVQDSQGVNRTLEFSCK
jgi:hypothetical protein